MTYRIITNHGTVDFAADLEIAQYKYKRYCIDMLAGYSKFVSLISVDYNGKEDVICSAKR